MAAEWLKVGPEFLHTLGIQSITHALGGINTAKLNEMALGLSTVYRLDMKLQKDFNAATALCHATLSGNASLIATFSCCCYYYYYYY